MFRKKIYFCMFLLGLLCSSLGVKAQTAPEAQVIPVNFEQSMGYFTALSDNPQAIPPTTLPTTVRWLSAAPTASRLTTT